MLTSQFNRLVPGQRLIQGGREYEIVKKDPVIDTFYPGGHEFTLKTRICRQTVFCTATTDRGDPDYESENDFIFACETLGRVWQPGESGDLSI